MTISVHRVRVEKAGRAVTRRGQVRRLRNNGHLKFPKQKRKNFEKILKKNLKKWQCWRVKSVHLTSTSGDCSWMQTAALRPMIPAPTMATFMLLDSFSLVSLPKNKTKNVEKKSEFFNTVCVYFDALRRDFHLYLWCSWTKVCLDVHSTTLRSPIDPLESYRDCSSWFR